MYRLQVEVLHEMREHLDERTRRLSEEMSDAVEAWQAQIVLIVAEVPV
jgi:hypothetical protein